MTSKTYHFYGLTDLAPIGQDSEMADMDNPNGTIYGYASSVVAEDETGKRTGIYVTTDRDEKVALDQATIIADRLTARFETLKKLPVDFEKWVDYGAAYGSASHDESALYDDEERAQPRNRSMRP